MPLVDCLGAVANALQIKEVTDKVDALVKKGKHQAEAEAIAKREFVGDEFGKLNDELNGIKKEVGVKAGKAEKLKPVNFSELNKKYKTDKEAATKSNQEQGVQESDTTKKPQGTESQAPKKEQQKPEKQKDNSVVGSENKVNLISDESKKQNISTEENKGNENSSRPLDEKAVKQKLSELDEAEIVDPYDKVLHYFANDGKIHNSAIEKLFGGKDKRLRQNTSTENERRSRIGLIKKDAPTIEGLAHKLWEGDQTGKYDTQDYKNAIEQVLLGYNSKHAMAKDLVEKYDYDAAYQKFIDQNYPKELIDKADKATDEMSDEELNHLLQLSSDESHQKELEDYIDNLPKSTEKKPINTETDTKMRNADISNASLHDDKNVGEYVSKAKSVLETLYPKAKLEVYDTEKEYLKNGGEPNTRGLGILDKNGEHRILLNLDQIKKDNSGKTAFHEVLHPIVYDAFGVSKDKLVPLWNSIADAMENVKGFEKVSEHISFYDKEQIPQEGLTELLTQIATGNIDLTDVPKSKANKIIDLVNKLFETLGIHLKLNSIEDFHSIANKIKDAFESGNAKDLKDVIKGNNIDKYITDLEKRLKDRDLSQEQFKEKIEKLKSLGYSDEDIKAAFKRKGIAEEKVNEILSQTKTENDALQKSRTGEVLQRQQEQTGETGSERSGVESGKQGEEAAGTRTEEKQQEEVGGEDETTSIKNATTRLRREQFGLNEEPPTARKEFGTTWDEAKRKIENGYDPQNLIEELDKKPRPVTDVENAILLHHQNTNEIKLIDLNDKINQAAEKGDDAAVQEYKASKSKVLDELQKIYDVDKKVGTENARGLASRQMMVNRRYSLANMVAEKRATANDGKPLSEAQQVEVEKLHKEIQTTKKAFDDYVTQAEGEIKELQEKILGKKVGDKKSAAQKLRDLADKVEKSGFGKASLGKDTQIQGVSVDINKLVAQAMRLVADGLDKGGEVLDLIKDAIEKIKETNPDVDEKLLNKEINKAVINADIVTKPSKEEELNKKYAGLISKGELDRKALQLKAANERAKNEFDISIKKDEASKRNLLQKGQNVFIKWQRAFKLSNPLTMGKLMMAGATRLMTTPLEDIVGAGYSKLMPKLSREAIGEGGGLNINETAKAYKNGLLEGMKDAAALLKKGQHGKSDIDVVFGKMGDLPPEAIDFFGQIHSATKAPIKRFAFERSLQKRLRRNLANGVDVSDPLVQTEILTSAYKDANRAIFMQDNKVATGFQNLIKYFERVDPKTGKAPSKPIATTLQWMLPFVKVPTNIASEIGTHVYGVESAGATLLYHAFTKGIDNLSVDEKDAIFRSLKKGTLGTAALLLGYFNPQVFGGFYQQGEKRKDDDAQALGLKLFGTRIPAWFVEAPIFQVMQLGATVRRVKDAKVKGEEKGIEEGMWAGALGLADKIPMIDQPMRMTKIFSNASERKYYLGELAKSTVDPALVSYMANVTDPADKGSVMGKILDPENKRKTPTTIVDHIKSGIPGLRETLPQKLEGGATDLKSLVENSLDSYKPDKDKIKKVDDEGNEQDISEAEFNKYVSLRDSKITTEIEKIYKNGIPVIKDGDVVLKPFKDATEKEIKDEIKRIKSDATTESKDELFPVPEDVDYQKRMEQKRMKLYRKDQKEEPTENE